MSAAGEDFLEWTWNPVGGADGYGVQFSPDGVFPDDGEVVEAQGTTHRVSELKSASSGYLRVRSTAGSLSSAWSETVGGETTPPNVAGDWLVDRGVMTGAIEPSTGCFAQWFRDEGGGTYWDTELSDFYLRIDQDEKDLTASYWRKPSVGEPDLDSDPPWLRFLASIADGGFVLTLDAIWSGTEDRFIPWAEYFVTHALWRIRGEVGPDSRQFSSLAQHCPEWIGQEYAWEPDDFALGATRYAVEITGDGTLSGIRESVRTLTIGSSTWTVTEGPDPVSAMRLAP